MNIKLTLGERLKDLRVERNLKLETLAEQTGLSKSALSKYESDDVTDLSIYAVTTLAEFYGVTTDYLLGVTENKKRPDAVLSDLHLSDGAVDVLRNGKFNHRLPAIASGIVFNIGASTGGTEIVAMILHKYIKVEIGRALLLSDIGTVLFAAYLYGPQTGMYCVLGLIGRSTIVDTAIESLNLRKVCTVITSRPEPIRHFVTETLGRTATQQNATGVYTGEPRTMIMVALTRRQAGLLRDFLRREDPAAFLTIVNSSEIIGKGFQSV